MTRWCTRTQFMSNTRYLWKFNSWKCVTSVSTAYWFYRCLVHVRLNVLSIAFVFFVFIFHLIFSLSLSLSFSRSLSVLSPTLSFAFCETRKSALVSMFKLFRSFKTFPWLENSCYFGFVSLVQNFEIVQRDTHQTYFTHAIHFTIFPHSQNKWT